MEQIWYLHQTETARIHVPWCPLALLWLGLLMQQLQYQLSHYLYKKPNFQGPGNKFQMGYLYPYYLLQKGLAEAYKWIATQSGPRHTFPVYQPEECEDLSLWRPLGHQTHVNFALVNYLGFGLFGVLFLFLFLIFFVSSFAMFCMVKFWEGLQSLRYSQSLQWMDD